MTDSVKVPCTECQEQARRAYDGEMYCDECYRDLLPMDFGSRGEP